VTAPLHWVLQTNLYSEEGWDTLVAALDKLGRPYSVHRVIPFSDGQPDPDPGLPDGARAITMGSYTLAQYAAARGWRPGAYLDNLDFEVQRAHWGAHMLNADAWVGPLRAYAGTPTPFFIRPVADTKAFVGQVMDLGELRAWQERLLAISPEDRPSLDGDTPIMAATKKTIYAETRTWIVGGRVVTASGYKLGTLPRQTPPDEVEPRITEFAQACADEWCPNRAFVLDVADTDQGLRIVEINNLNSAGFYKGDVHRLIAAIEQLEG